MALYPEVDWKPIAKYMWQWTEHYWDESWDNYSKIVPEYIFEFPTYEELNEHSFDGSLGKEEYAEIINCYAGITSGNPDDEINMAIRVPIDMGNYVEGAAFSCAEPLVYEEIEKIERILIKHSIELPKKDVLAHFVFRKEDLAGREPWGDFENTEEFSVILNCKNNLF